METFKYKAFISYSHADERWGRWLHRQLEAFQLPSRLPEKEDLPKRPLRPVFRDRDELAGSSDLNQSLLDALAESENLIVICSRNAAASRWVDAEVRSFVDLGRRDQIFALLVDPDAHGAFPDAFAIEGIEVVAGDVVQDGRRNALLKIIAGLLSLRFGDLRDRHEQQRRSQLAAVATFSLTGFAFTAALAGYALFARDQADAARVAADNARETSEQVTEFVVGMLEKANPTNLNPDEISIRDVLDQGYDTALERLVDNPRVRAEVLTAIGKAYDTLGIYEENLELHREVLEALRSTGDTPNAEFGRALINYGAALSKIDTPEANAQARALYEEAIALLKRLDPPAHFLIGNAQTGLGIFFSSTRRPTEARQAFERSIEAYLRMPEPDYVRLAWGYQNLANAWLFGTTSTPATLGYARDGFQRALEIIDEQDLDDHVLSSTVALNLGSVLLQLDDPSAARRILEPAHERLTRLLGVHDRVVYATRLLGNAEMLQGEYAQAEQRFSEALRLANQIPGGMRDQMYGVITTYLGDLAVRRGQDAKAAALYREAFDYFGSPVEPEKMFEWLRARVETYPLDHRRDGSLPSRG